jgi:hypothetical protein
MKRSTRHLPAIRQRLAIRVQVEMKETRLTGSEEAALVPLRDVMVIPGLLIGHSLIWFVLCVDYHTTVGGLMEVAVRSRVTRPDFRA